MRKLALLMILILFASLALGQAAKASKPAASHDAAQLKDIENKWNDALLKADTAYIDSITAPDYVTTQPDGKLLKKAEVLDRIKSGSLKWESSTINDVNVHVYGAAAVVTAAFTEKGVDDGKPFQDSGRFTDTFIKKDGKWLAVASQGTLKPAAKAAAKPAAKTEKK